jgi:hypothetical protein
MDTAHRRIWLTVGLAVVLQASIARAELVERNPSEADEDFMARVLGPSAELAQKVVRSTELAGGKPTLIGFVTVWDKSEDHNEGGDFLVGHLLIQMSPGRYDHVKFTSCEEEGATPELLAIFFARTAKGAGRDLAVLCQWEVRHAVAEGTSYGARFYRLRETGSKMHVEPATALNKKFNTDDLVVEDKHGKWVSTPKPTFKTVADVKKLLTKMGLKQ